MSSGNAKKSAQTVGERPSPLACQGDAERPQTHRYISSPGEGEVKGRKCKSAWERGSEEGGRKEIFRSDSCMGMENLKVNYDGIMKLVKEERKAKLENPLYIDFNSGKQRKL